MCKDGVVALLVLTKSRAECSKEFRDGYIAALEMVLE